MEKIDIMSLDLAGLEEAVAELGEKKFRAKQIFQWLHIKKFLNSTKCLIFLPNSEID